MKKYFNDFTFTILLAMMLAPPFILIKEGDFRNSTHLVLLCLVEFILIGLLSFRIYHIDVLDKNGIKLKAKIISSNEFYLTGSAKAKITYEFQNKTFTEEISLSDLHVKEGYLDIKIDPKNPQRVLVVKNL